MFVKIPTKGVKGQTTRWEKNTSNVYNSQRVLNV